MPILKQNYGVHENITILEFGTGDIMFTRASEKDDKFESTLIFSQTWPHEIGAEEDIHKDQTSDEIPDVQVVFRFKKPESITALIHSLIEIQKEVFRAQKEKQNGTV